MTATDQTIKQVAKELAESFTTDKRAEGGETYTKIADDAPAWTRERTTGEKLMFRVHKAVDGGDPRLPNDWVYSSAASIADSLGEYDSIEAMQDAVHEICDSLVDVYNSDLTQWLADHSRNASLVDDAKSEGLCEDCDLIKQIQAGQYIGLTRIASQLIEEIENEADSREEEHTDEDLED